jgi:KDO2-lipid IV(A) lauroyltransferase
MRSRIDGVDGHDHYVAARKLGRGAIILTAHMGSFELGLAALTAIEPKVHVVFKRDTEDGFETIRQNLRHKLGVIEAPIDDGWTIWIKLRDALRADQVVILQGDRAMPGQKSQPVPVAGGHVALPLGPLMLAMASEAPIVPIFTLATAPGRCRVFVEDPIIIDPQAEPVDGVHPSLLKIGKVIEKYVVAHPDQWLVLDRAFVEDAVTAK